MIKEAYSNYGYNIFLIYLQKMSKSLGNVILIRDFIQKYSVNVLRLLCIRTHYRSGKFFAYFFPPSILAVIV